MKQLLCKKLNLCEQIKKQWSKHQGFGHMKDQSLSFHLSQINVIPKNHPLFSFSVLHRCFPKRKRPSTVEQKISDTSMHA